MASTGLYYSTALNAVTYTDSGGSTHYSQFLLHLGRITATAVQESSVATVAGPVGSTGPIESLNSTQLVWVSEQLKGMALSTALYTNNVWAAGATGGMNATMVVRLQILSSGSTFIDNVFTDISGSSLTTTFAVQNWVTVPSTAGQVLSSGGRLGVSVLIGDLPGFTLQAGGSILFQFGPPASTDVLGDSWIESPTAFSTFVTAAAPATKIIPFANSLMSVGIGVAGLPEWPWPDE